MARWKRSDHVGGAHPQQDVTSSRRRGTGPRTPTGKNRSKLNATKHGLFSQVVVLDHESQPEFDELQAEVRRVLAPLGPLEEALADKIVVTLWRYRRLFQAERATVQERVELQQERDAGISRSLIRARWERERDAAETDRLGSLPFIDEDRETLEDCLEKLASIYTWVERYGLRYDEIRVNLGVIYGARYPGRPGHDLFDDYSDCLRSLESKGSASEIDLAHVFMEATEKEFLRIEAHRKGKPPQEPDIYEVKPDSLSVLKLVIPVPADMEPLVRYETHLDRTLSRALMELEHAQALRREQKTIVIPKTEKLAD